MVTVRAFVDLTEADIELLDQLGTEDVDDDAARETWAFIDANVFEVISILRRLANSVETNR